MTSKHVLGAAVFVGLTFTVAQSCLRKVDNPETQLTAAQVDKVQNVVRVFRRLVGRDPGTSEINAMKALPYNDLVTSVLGSAQFDQEGFFNLHRERLLLNREGSQQWVKGSYKDYCALRLELAEQASADRSGKGYWETLRYRDRWVPLVEFGMNQCFFGASVGDLTEAWKKYGGPTPPPPPAADAPPPTSREKNARSCVQSLKFGLPGDFANPNPEARVKEFFTKLEALDAEAKKLSLLSVPEAEAIMMDLVKQSMLPDFGPLPEGVTPLADMKLELVKKDGKPLVLQELGSQGNQQCLFSGVDPVSWVKTKQPGGGGGFGGDDDFNGGGFGFPEVVPPPIDFPAPVGIPDQPVLVPLAGAQMAPNVQEAMAKADGPLFLKIRMPAEFQGLHGSPYWLSRHTTKQKNKNLHRARAVYFSYFCTEINPDAANFQGAPVAEVPAALKGYFADDDAHAKGSTNCFNCHAKIQPIANFFGLLSFGTPYDQGFGFGGGWPQFLNEEGAAFSRPGGIYDGQKFFEHEGTNMGLEGFANTLPAYPAVGKCIADSTWAALVGRDFPLFETERQAAVTAFQGENGAKPSFSRLLKHFLTESKRGQAYFSQGEKAFEMIQPDTAFVCPEVPPEDFQASGTKLMEGQCVDCHSDGFFDEAGKFSIDSYFTNQGVDDTPKARGRLWHNLYCKVKLEKMPPGGGLDAEGRGKLWCWLGRTRDALAKESKIPAEYLSKVCQGAAPTMSSMGAAHTVSGTPGGN